MTSPSPSSAFPLISPKHQNLAAGTAPFIIALMYLLWHLAYRLASAGNALYPFDGPFNDGPFQLHNPLRRMDLGESIGSGFSFFHGPALPALHYPLHWLAGKTIHASELARHLASILAFHGGWLAIFWAWTGSLRKAVVPWALAVLATDAWDMWQLAECDNSLYGLRGVTPLLAAASALAPFRPSARSGLCGFFLGLSLLLGTELGLAAILGAGLSWLVALAIPVTRWGAIRSCMVACPASAAGLLVPLLLLGGPPAISDFFQFNLGIVPADQFWYFGVPPNPFIHSFQQFFTIEYVRTTLLVAGIAGAIVGVWIWQSPEKTTALVLLSLLHWGGIATYALMGVLNPVYIGTLRRSLIVILIMASWKTLTDYSAQSALRATRANICLTALFLAAVVFWPTSHRYEGIFKVPQVAKGLGLFAQAVAHLPDGKISPRLQGDLDQIVAQVESRFPDPANRQGQLWSTFAGLPEDQLGITHPFCDYIIHALGPRRTEYAARFADLKPALAIIPGLSKFPYENWVRDSNWPFYETVYLNYTTLLTTSGHILLQKKEAWSQPDAWDGESTTNGSGQLSLPPGRPGKLLSVELEFSTHSRWGWLPMVGKLPRWLVFREGGLEKIPVSLPPFETSWRFSSRAEPGAVVTLNPVAASPWGGKLTFLKARWRWIDTTGLAD